MTYMTHLINQLDHFIRVSKANWEYVMLWIWLLWLIHCINAILRHHLNALGILPRTLRGFFGIFFAPFLHANLNHLFFNTIPLLILLNLLMIYGKVTFMFVSLSIIVLSGLSTWLFGRKAIHIGASAVIMGYWSYLLVNAYYQGTTIAIVMALLCLYYLGGLLLNLFPKDARTSWEGHLFGFLAGIATVYLEPLLLILYKKF